MATTINLRDVDEELHRALRIRAAELRTTVKALVVRYCEEGLARDWGKSPKPSKKGG